MITNKCFDSECGNFCPYYENNCDALSEAIEPDECFARISKRRDQQIYHEIMAEMENRKFDDSRVVRVMRSEFKRQKRKESYRE